ncbi:MAG: M23 family metallopeptidase [Bacteroidota bacterium]|nr:M23 family metallopeptidase [Bacteroidota bacterium]
MLILVVPSLWFRISERQQPSIQKSSTSHVDSTSTTILAPKNVTNQSGPTPKIELPPPAVMAPPSPVASSPASTGLIIPVAGATADQLADTYTQARGNGRIHDAIDIMAPHNSPVIAAASGQVVRLFQSKLGGTTIYELSPDGHTIYYYAHLDHYADGLTEGEQVAQGQLLGYVGDSGDAGPGNYHLHFAIWLIQDSKKFWDGVNVNPYPILRQVK